MSNLLALVTGANHGIGKEIARLLGSEPNVHVIITARNTAAGMAAVAELSAAGNGKGQYSFFPCDITSQHSVDALREHIAHSHGNKLDILVNNAGIAFKGVAPPIT